MFTVGERVKRNPKKIWGTRASLILGTVIDVKTVEDGDLKFRVTWDKSFSNWYFACDLDKL